MQACNSFAVLARIGSATAVQVQTFCMSCLFFDDDARRMLVARGSDCLVAAADRA